MESDEAGVITILGLRHAILVGLVGTLAMSALGATAVWSHKRFGSWWRPVPVGISLLLVGILVRLVFAITVGTDWQYGIDPYVQLAASIAEGNGFTDEEGIATAFYPPGWSMILGAVFWVFSASATTLLVVTTIVGLLFVLAVYWLALTIFDRRIALIAAAIAMWYPAGFFFSFSALKDLPFTLGVVVGSVLLVKIVQGARREQNREEVAQILGLGAVLAILVLMRTDALLLAVIAIVILAATAQSRYRRTVAIAAIVAPVLVVSVGWTYRNIENDLGRSPISTNGGFNLWVGHNPDRNLQFQDLEDIDPPDGFTQSDLENMGEAELDRTLRKAAISYIGSNLEKVILDGFKKVVLTFGSDLSSLSGVNSGNLTFLPDEAPNNFTKGDLYFLAAIVNGFYWLLIVGAVAGVVLLVRAGNLNVAAAMLIVPAVITFNAYAFFAIGRLHLTAIPFFIVLAAYAIARLTPEREADSSGRPEHAPTPG